MMQDIKRNRRKISNKKSQSSVGCSDIEIKFDEPICEEEMTMDRGYKSKKKDDCYDPCNNPNKSCDPCHDHHDHHHDCCDPCHDHHHDCCDPCHDHHHDCCDPCDCESDPNECIPNNCGPECCKPIVPSDFSTNCCIPIAIETNRVFDTMRFQTFSDATGPNGEPLTFDIEVVDVDGNLPSCGPIDVNIDKICIKYESLIIDTGFTTLEDFELEDVDYKKDRNCDTVFEYNINVDMNRKCCNKCLGQSANYKQRGLTVIANELFLELKGRCGCTRFTAVAIPAIRDCGCKKRIPCVEFNFNTLSAPICLPSDGRSVLLRQEYNTNLTVDCIGKAQLRVHEECCECFYELCIPNDIDIILCLEEIVSILISEQVVVLGSKDPIHPRIVDTFSKVCDFDKCNKHCE